MRVRAIRSHFVDGRIVARGEVYELTDTTARELIAAGRVEIAPEPAPPPIAEPQKPKAAYKPEVKTK
jgi:hypothetical protein